MDAPVILRPGVASGSVPIDPYRAFIFPNAIRELRRRAGYQKLIGLAHRLPGLTYIRLSKIERGEVTARAHELTEVAAVLGVAPEALLVDVDAFRDEEGLEALDLSIRERHVLDKGGFVWVTGFPVLAPCVHLLQGVFAAKPLAQNAGKRA